MDSLCYVDETLLKTKTAEETAMMLGEFGLEADVPEVAAEIDPNQPGAKMTGFCLLRQLQR